MIVKAITIAGGLAGAAGLSQYPEFSQQYTQNLAGQVEALQTVVSDFDASAARSEMTREEALTQMVGTDFLEDRREDMTRTFARYERLSDHYAALRSATPMERLTMPHRLGDGETFESTWENFSPAMPLTWAGALSTVLGFIGGAGIVGGLVTLLSYPFRRRKKPA